MAIRAAAASTDGKVINQHFGKADSFLIFELNNGEFQYIEKRDINPCCHLGEHEENAFEGAAKAIGDCSIIIVSRIGRAAADFMESRGFEIYEAPFPINAVLKKLVEERDDCGNKL